MADESEADGRRQRTRVRRSKPASEAGSERRSEAGSDRRRVKHRVPHSGASNSGALSVTSVSLSELDLHRTVMELERRLVATEALLLEQQNDFANRLLSLEKAQVSHEVDSLGRILAIERQQRLFDNRLQQEPQISSTPAPTIALSPRGSQTWSRVGRGAGRLSGLGRLWSGRRSTSNA